MSSPVLALRAAIRTLCLPDATLAGLMSGATRLYDDPPRGSVPVYGLFGDVTLRDWSTSESRGHEQEAAIVVWARPGSAAGAVAAADRIAALVDDAPLALSGHHLVHLRVSAVETDRDPESGLSRSTVRLRAVTEVAN